MAIVADTGGIVALYDSNDRYHAEVSALFRQPAERVILPSPLLGELGYVLLQWLGTAALLQLFTDIESNAFEVEPFLTKDAARCRQLVRTYADLDLGLCGAAVIATAERLGVHRILTVDERDFRVVRSADGKPFTLLPADRPKGKRRG